MCCSRVLFISGALTPFSLNRLAVGSQTCAYVASKDDPGSWHGSNSSEFGLDRDHGYDGLGISEWRCPHPPLGQDHDDDEYCVFHTDTEVPIDYQRQKLLEALDNAGEGPWDDRPEHRGQFVEATFGAINLSGETISATDDHGIRFDHARFQTKDNHLDFKDTTFTTQGQYPVSFNRVEFITDGDGHVRFDEATFRTIGDGNVTFDNVAFRTTGDGHMRFDSTMFRTTGDGDGNVWFNDTTFRASGDGNVWFNDATFRTTGDGDDNVWFFGATFKTDGGGSIWFKDTTFRTTDDGHVVFQNTTFKTTGGSSVWFFGATFRTDGDGHVGFSDAIFRTNGDGNILFTNTTLTDADFKYVDFGETALGGS